VASECASSSGATRAVAKLFPNRLLFVHVLSLELLDPVLARYTFGGVSDGKDNIRHSPNAVDVRMGQVRVGERFSRVIGIC